MKCVDFKHLLDRAINFRSLGGAGDEARRLREFLPILDSFADKPVSQFAKSIQTAPPDNNSPQQEITELIDFLRSLSVLLAEQAKPAVADLGAIISALEPHSESNFGTLRASLSKPNKPKKGSKTKSNPAVRDEVVLKYARRLEEALGDDSGFNSVFATLETDKELTSGEVIAIAKKFSYPGAKSRPAALKKIFSRHQAIMISRAKSAATAGRIAG